ncbi:MAG: two-component system sensor histidine kinase NtrB [Pikeienuella sp.]
MLPFPALVIAPDDRVSAANNAAESFLGIAEAQMKTREIGDLFGETTRVVGLTRRARRSAASASDHDVEFSWPGRAPEQLDLLAMATDDAGEILLIFQRRSFAAHIDRSLTHRHAARSMTGMAAMLAHEIRNPLAGISGAAQLLEMGASEEDRQLTELIRDEAQRITDLINRVEAFGDTGPLRRDPINIHDVLDRAKRSAEAGFAKHIRFHEDYDPSLPEVPGDHNQLVQVMLNLLKNAAEATPPVGGVVTLRTSYRPGVAMSGPHGGDRVSLPLLVQVSDNGAGIPDDMQREIFEPFVTTKAQGGGLGLSLVSKIVSDHGGAIDCVSRPGWTSFRLRLPIWRDAPDPIHRQEV